MSPTPLLRAAATALALGFALSHAQAGAAPHGVFAFAGLDVTPPAAIYRDASVVGVTLARSWAALEPSPGQFDWAALDADVDAAASAGRQVALSVTPGVFAPAWLYAQGAARLTSRWTLSWGYPMCATVSMPLPWDPVYEAAWTGFVAALGHRYAGNPAVTMVKITGVTAATAEMLLPYSVAGQTPDDGLPCGNTPIAPLSTWKAAGYRPGKVLAALGTFVSAFAEDFPSQQLVLQTGPWAFPPIDESGNVVAGSTGDAALPRTLLLAAARIAGGRFVLENDGLRAVWSWARPAYLPAAIPVAYQAAARVSNDPTCRMNGYVAPCPPAKVMQAAVARSNTAGAAFLELYLADLLNPALALSIAAAD